MENNIERLHNELEEARRNFHQTVADVNQKVEIVSAQLQPENLLERHLPLAACVVGALGFAAGTNNGGVPILGTLILGGLLGAVFGEALNHGFGEHETTLRT
jgi:hypothetical protein